MRHANIPIYIDLLFCLLIIPPIIMVVPVEKWIVHHTAFMLTLIAYLYGLYFVYRKARIPQLFMQHKFRSIILLVAILVCITILLTHFPFPPPHDTMPPLIQKAKVDMRTQVVWFFFLVVTGFSLSIELIFELFRQILSKQEIEAEKNKAELALYKAQINPHFLFNTLNTLYGLVLTKSDKTESAFIKFSNILKYMYSQTTSDTISVNNEIEYIHQYVDLQSLRLNKHTQIIFETQTDDEQVQIPPMVLITFVENAFKYGTSSDIDCTIFIRILVKDNKLLFETENTIMGEKQEGKTQTIGIENCRKRLNLYYPGRFELTTQRENQQFKVHLMIQLQ